MTETANYNNLYDALKTSGKLQTTYRAKLHSEPAGHDRLRSNG